MSEDFWYFNPWNPVERHQAKLPHWEQDRVIYFVTFRLADSLPASFWENWKEERAIWVTINPAPHTPEQTAEYRQRFLKPLQHRLDTGHGSMVLNIPEIREATKAILLRRDAADYRLDAFTLAGNHAHTLVTPAPGVSLSKILQAWKSLSARAALNHPAAFARLAEHQPGRSRPVVWQKESFDHIVRSEEHLEKFRRYILAHEK